MKDKPIKPPKKFWFTEAQIEDIKRHIPKITHSKSTHYFYNWHVNKILNNIQENQKL